jgi:23S rRNA pseudouridine1911/1915/1917 synthase
MLTALFIATPFLDKLTLSVHRVKTNEARIVFHDDELLVVDKPGGMVCHSAQRPGQRSLAEWLREQGITTPRLINRLDRETSGLVVIAKTERAGTILGKAVLRREIEKEYVAICWGEFTETRGVVDKPIRLTRQSAVYTKREVDETDGQPAITEFEVRATLGCPKCCYNYDMKMGAPFAVVRLRPRTGRTHQLRVHMAWLGHPIVGDKVYGPDENLYLQFIREGVTPGMLDKLLLPRHALHAASLAFTHPGRRQRCEFEAPLPGDMQEFIDRHR